MRKNTKTLLVLLAMLAVVLIAGWKLGLVPGRGLQTQRTKTTENQPPSTKTDQNQPAPTDNEVKISGKAWNKDATRNLTLLKSVDADVDGDKQDESIELYTSARKDPSGNIEWDDGQNWLLLVKDGATGYPLFDDRIQLGQLDVQVYAAGDGQIHIVSIGTDSASMKECDYTYNKDQKCFVQKVVYNPAGVNWLTSYEPYK